MIAVLGAGPHGRAVAKAISARRKVITILHDDTLDGYPNCDLAIRKGLPTVIGAAWPATRRSIAARYPDAHTWLDGCVVFPGAQISHEAHMGEHCHIGFNAVVTHGCQLGAYVNVSPGAVLAGDVTVGDDVFVGANATIIHGGITIGQGATIGAGAVVIDDVPPGATVAGVPARKLR